MRLNYRLVNVFTVDDARLSGNPLCVFEDGKGLHTSQMRALALQFNLSETSFILPAENATAAVRIFTPAMELPFAGHPTLGTAFVARDLLGAGDAITLSMPAGVIEVTALGNVWTLRAGPPKTRELAVERGAALAAALHLPQASIAGSPMWVSTGMEQLLVPLASTDAVNAAKPDGALSSFANDFGKVGVYVFSPLASKSLKARFFFGKTAGAISEDPATGSACANLGGFAIARGCGLPLSRTISQGEMVGRASRLHLSVDSAEAICVSGEVIELGRGFVEL